MTGPAANGLRPQCSFQAAAHFSQAGTQAGMTQTRMRPGDTSDSLSLPVSTVPLRLAVVVWLSLRGMPLNSDFSLMKIWGRVCDYMMPARSPA